MAYSAGNKAGRNHNSLANKKGVNKVSAREVVQCLNYNYFLCLNINVALVSSLVRCNKAKDMPKKITKKKAKHHAFKC